MLKPAVQIVAFTTVVVLGPVFSHAQGTLYKWTDAQGNVHYTNTPTSNNATAVDNALPPAAVFKSPTPPPAPATPAPPEASDNPTPSDEGGETSANAPDAPPTPEPPAADESTGEPPTEAQPEPDEKPQLTPEQEQALKDSPM